MTNLLSWRNAPQRQAYQATHAPLQAPADVITSFGHIKDPQRRTFAAMAAVVDEGIGAGKRFILRYSFLMKGGDLPRQARDRQVELLVKLSHNSSAQGTSRMRL